MSKKKAVTRKEQEIWFRPDKDNLIEEIEAQPDMAVEVHKLYAKATRNYMRLKDELKVLEAELGSLARSDSENQLGQGVRATDKAVEEFVLGHRKRKMKMQELIEAEELMLTCKGGIAGIDNKKESIKQLVYSEGTLWHSEPKFGGETGKKVRDKKMEKHRSAYTKKDFEEDEE